MVEWKRKRTTEFNLVNETYDSNILKFNSRFTENKYSVSIGVSKTELLGRS